jgi:hypothetical protein
VGTSFPDPKKGVKGAFMFDFDWMLIDPIDPFCKHHLCIHHLQNGEGTFVAFKKRFLVDMLAHLYALFLENKPLEKI